LSIALETLVGRATIPVIVFALLLSCSFTGVCALPGLFKPSLLELPKGIALCESVVGYYDMNVGWLR